MYLVSDSVRNRISEARDAYLDVLLQERARLGETVDVDSDDVDALFHMGEEIALEGAIYTGVS
jgi:hypothetical protein